MGWKLAYTYGVAAVVLMLIAAGRTGASTQWFWRAGAILFMLTVSLRSGLVYIHRDNMSKLPWLLQPGHTEHEFSATWLFYACLGAVGAVLMAVV